MNAELEEIDAERTPIVKEMQEKYAELAAIRLRLAVVEERRTEAFYRWKFSQESKK